MNVRIIGNVGKELKVTKEVSKINQKKSIYFSVAVNKGKDQETEWWTCFVKADILKYKIKGWQDRNLWFGSRVLVEGRGNISLRTNEYNQTNMSRLVDATNIEIILFPKKPQAVVHQPKEVVTPPTANPKPNDTYLDSDKFDQFD